MAWTFPQIYTLCLVILSSVCGAINLFQLIIFINRRKLRLVRARNPPLIIQYCIISLILSFIVTPITLYYHGIQSDADFFALFASEFFEEFITTILLVLILCRSWLLFFDYKFHESSSDAIWRQLVDSNEESFWIKNRKTVGNLQFIICMALIINTLSLLSLSLIGYIALRIESTTIFHYWSLFGLGLPFYALIIYLILYKIEIYDDIYSIHKEIKFLSLCVVARIIAFSIDLILHSYDHWLLFYTVEVVTNFICVWIQCQWIFYQNKAETDDDIYTGLGLSAKFLPNLKSKLATIESLSVHHNVKRKKASLQMIDVFNNEISAKVFIRHCCNEMSVESVLFLIETAQFKATLQKYNAFGIKAVHFRFLDVNNMNIVKYIQRMRTAKRIARSPSINSFTNESPTNQDAMIADFDAAPNTSLTPSTSKTQNFVQLKGPTVGLKEAGKIELGRNDEAEYKEFQETVLTKKWLPIATPLLCEVDKPKSILDKVERSRTKSSKSSKSSKEKSSSSGGSTKQSSFKDVSGMQSRLTANNFIAPISMAVIDNKSEDPTDVENKSKSDVTVDVNWMFEYGKHLFAKYIKNSAQLAINTSYDIRRNLWTIYSKGTNEEAFQSILLMHHDDLSAIPNLSAKEEQLLLQTYLYHSFDLAFHSVWNMLKSDTFFRFQQTKEYRVLCEQWDAQKLEEERNQRDMEYSRSLKEHEIMEHIEEEFKDSVQLGDIFEEDRPRAPSSSVL